MAWILVNDYAKKLGVTRMAINKRIKSGSLKSKMEGKRLYVEVADNEAEDGKVAEVDATAQRNAALAKRWDTESALKEAKVRNIEADILIKHQKVREYRERLRVEFCEGVLECFTDAFASLKAVLVDMRLKKEQIQAFKTTYAKCLKKFWSRLEKYLKQKDKEEEETVDDQATEAHGG